MPVITSLEAAESFFMSNSSGSILCQIGIMEKVCDCYPDAKAFFDDNS